MWYAKPTGGYANTSTEGLANATNIKTFLQAQGWDLKAICALLGNGVGESGLNPWRWESDYVPTVSEFEAWTPAQATSHGYGLFGFTPASNYINNTNMAQLLIYGYGPNFSDNTGRAIDGNAQLFYFNSTAASNWSSNLFNYYNTEFTAIGVDISTFYYVSFNDFILGVNGNTQMTLEECVGAFELCYEKPAATAAANSYNTRVTNAQYWYNYFSNNPVPPYNPSVGTENTWKFWLFGI